MPLYSVAERETPEDWRKMDDHSFRRTLSMHSSAFDTLATLSHASGTSQIANRNGDGTHR